jgi:hypothetical protein
MRLPRGDDLASGRATRGILRRWRSTNVEVSVQTVSRHSFDKTINVSDCHRYQRIQNANTSA